MPLAFFGMPSLAASVFLELCLVGWLIFLLAGEWMVALKVWLYGRWFIVALYGACGGNVTIDSSRTKKEPLRTHFFFLLFFVLLDGCIPCLSSN
jgi:hypothetical protein